MAAQRIDIIEQMRATGLSGARALAEQVHPHEDETADAADEGHATARVVAELDGCVLYRGIPHREDRDRDALAQANAMTDADAEVTHYKTALDREKAEAHAANPLCIHCEKPVTDLDRATYLPNLRRLAHHGQCGITAVKEHWGHLLGGVHVAQEPVA